MLRKSCARSLTKYPSCEGLKIHAIHGDVACRGRCPAGPADVWKTGGTTEMAVIRKHALLRHRPQETCPSSCRWRDRNGTPMPPSASRMETYTGQTQQNALVRRSPSRNRSSQRDHPGGYASMNALPRSFDVAGCSGDKTSRAKLGLAGAGRMAHCASARSAPTRSRPGTHPLQRQRMLLGLTAG
jgi:hypothetical protein